MKYKIFSGLNLLFVYLLLSGCSWFGEKADPTAGWSADQFYTEAKTALNEGNYQTAIEYFEKLQARYPFGRYAQQAQLELIYAHYRDEEPDQAIAAADRFIRTHPRHPFVDYAYYLKGLVNFNRSDSVLDRMFPNDPTRTDTATHLQAFNDFTELVQKFPNSKYAPDARQRMLFLRNNLAEYETNVADFYLRRKAYVAAVNRAKYVLENYSRTPSAERALGLMAEAYLGMGMHDLASDSLRVLQVNYPDSYYVARVNALMNGEKPPAPEGKSMLSSLYDFF